MDGRISVGMLAVTLALGAAGCVTTNVPTPDKNAAAAAPTPAPAPVPVNNNGNTTTVKTDDTPWPKQDRNHKHDPLPGTEIAFGKMKETESDSIQLKNNPEAQARLRDEARKAYQKAIKLDPNYLDAYRHLGRLYVKMGDTDRALENYKNVLVKHAKESGIWYDMGLCYTRRKDLGESARCFSKALELEPENPEYMKKLGLTLAFSGQIDQGFAYLTRGHQASSLAHYDIARVLVQKGQVEPAKIHLRIALRENAQLEGAGEMLAWLENPSAGTPRRFSLESPQ